MKPIFHKGPPLIVRIIFFVVLAVLLWLLDSQTDFLKPLRRQLMSFSAPLHRLTILPSRVLEWGDHSLVSRESLLSENLALKAENRVLQQRLQKMATLIAENARLTELLNSSHYLGDEKILVSRLIGISPDPLRQQFVLDKGSEDGVSVGTAVLDAHGVVGQVIEVSGGNSRVMLVTDARSAVPVQVIRSGVRLVAAGIGNQNELLLRHVAATADIQTEDVLVTSGLDGRYPANYPVARVDSVERDPNQPFLVVRIVPMAQLDRSRHFLLVLKEGVVPDGGDTP